MRIHVLSFTARGAALAGTIAAGLAAGGHETVRHDAVKNVMGLVAEIFPGADGLVFVGACGIAVRSIAPCLRGKTVDPAVVVCDEAGGFAISLLSGHVGGANELAGTVAGITGAAPVITTATDVSGVFAVDTWAVRQGLGVENPEAIRDISGALLRGETVGLQSDCPVEGDLPPGLALRASGPLGIYIGPLDAARPFETTLHLYPRDLVVGCGCRRGTGADAIRAALHRALEQNGLDIRRVGQVCSVDLKADEAGLHALARTLGAALRFYSAAELEAVPGKFSGSEFVRGVAGVDNVCERSAVRCGGDGALIVKKQSLNGVTIAVFRREYVVNLNG